MQLLSQINEAADLPLDQVIPAMKKDKRVKMIFTRLEPDEVKDWPQLISTLQYYFFNNQNVIRYFASKGNATEHANNTSFRYLRGKLPKWAKETADKYDLEQVKHLLNALTKELAKDEAPNKLSGLKKLIDAWHEDRRGRIHDWVQKGLFTFPSIRPKTPQLLYRGLLFSEKELREYSEWGTLKVGSGLKFLRSVREGTRTVDLEWGDSSAWTPSLEEAIQFAHSGDAVHSTEKGKMNWRGKLGFVVSTHAQPEDIIVDTRLVPEDLAYYLPKNTLMLVPGKRLCRLVKRFTPEGEEDVMHKDEDLESELDDMREMLILLHSIIKPPAPEPRGSGIGHGSTTVEDLKRLIDPAIGPKIHKMIDKVHEVYAGQLHQYADKDLAKLGGTKVGKIVGVVQELIRKLTGHVTTKQGAGRYGRGESEKRFKVPAEVAHQFDGYSDSRALRFIGATEKRFTDWSTGNPLNHMGHLLGVKNVDKIHLSGVAVQKAQLKKVLDEYRAQVRPDLPTDTKAATAQIADDFDLYAKNAKALTYLYEIKQLLAGLEE